MRGHTVAVHVQSSEYEGPTKPGWVQTAIETPFPAPAGELDVAAQLAKDPLPRSLHSSLRRAAESAASSSRRREDADPEARARALAAAKKEWLSWKSI